MSKSTIFIADLHLSDSQPEILKRFKEFLKDKARNARALFVLGDLFEYYLGDDAMTDVVLEVSNEFKELANIYDTKCYFMAGNRDFLISSGFSKSAKIKILTDSHLLKLDNNKIILTHGDQLCTDDLEYQQVRKQLRSKKWQQWFLNQSIDERIAFANQARIQSQKHTKSINLDIMDVNQQAVDSLFNTFKSQFMIHGHTHRPAFHISNSQQRMVVGDWHNQTNYIEYKNNSFQLITY